MSQTIIMVPLSHTHDDMIVNSVILERFLDQIQILGIRLFGHDVSFRSSSFEVLSFGLSFEDFFDEFLCHRL